jgi:hypothetical protein
MRLHHAALLVAVSLTGCAPAPRETRVAGPIQPRRHAQAGPVAEKKTVELRTEDALGAPVRLGAGQERVTMVVLMSRESKDESAQLVRSFDEKLLNAPVESVGIVDMRKYGGIMRSIATSQLKKSASEARDRRRERREAKGVDASSTYVNRWHLVGDFDGELMKKFGVAANLDHPQAFVVDKDGGLHGPYRDLDGLMAAVDHAMASTGRATSKDKTSRMRASSGPRTRL